MTVTRTQPAPCDGDSDIKLGVTIPGGGEPPGADHVVPPSSTIFILTFSENVNSMKS